MGRGLVALVAMIACSGCIYVEAGGGPAFPTSPSTSTAEATVAGAMGVCGDIGFASWRRGLRLAGGIGTTHGTFDVQDERASYVAGKVHLRADQTVWADAPVYVRWTLGGEASGEAWWQDDDAEPLEGSGFGFFTGPTLTVGFEGREERELAEDGAAHFTLAFHLSSFETAVGTVTMPGLQIRAAIDFNLGGQLLEGMRDGMN